MRGHKNQPLKPKQLQALRCIRNSLMHYGRAPSTRELMVSLGYRSPRSAALIIEDLTRKGVLKKRSDGGIQLIKDLEMDSMNARTVDVPLVGTVACGLPILAEENIQGMIPVSVNLARPSFRYFLLKASGDSMDEANINDGDLVLVRQQPMAEDGDIVVALIDDEATIKEFRSANNSVILKPRSSNKKHKPIILTDNFQVQGVVVATIPNFE
jgi:repressor LexA